MTRFNRKALIVALVAAFSALPGAAQAKDKPEDLCKNELLTYRQRYQCQEELENIRSKSDEKAMVRKFSDLIRAAEKEKAEK